ncbi:MAG TPA: tol-pal system-associated acyl-CoA thioesterase [Mariprofundaceae bacterium]|nr:tol-pal system-associated acyl-CoA thioesterase [Mariprofundaceae bacterium]
MTGARFSFPVRVYYEDTDHGGVVYHANYLKFLERARSEFMRTLGIELDAVDETHGILFALTEARVRFKKPARFNDMLIVETGLTSLGGVRLSFEQAIYHIDSKQLLVEATIDLASIDRDGKVRRIPEPVAKTLANHLLPQE